MRFSKFTAFSEYLEGVSSCMVTYVIETGTNDFKGVSNIIDGKAFNEVCNN